MNGGSKNFCFVLMPFSNEFKNQWDMAFVPAIKSVGLKPFRADEEELGTNMIMRDITKCISEASLIIADLTGRNPNVMYELGLAHSAKKPVIILTQSEGDIPFDVRHIRYLKYDLLNFKALQADLKNRIKSTLNQATNEIPDFFPELKIMKESDMAELEYLRQISIPIDVQSFPPTADIFFNDRLIGIGKANIFVNPDAPKNTISAATIEHLEYHEDIRREEIQERKINIVLEIRDQKGLEQHVPKYLRYRRRDPDNPVLMRAISQYLFKIGRLDEALIEAKELLDVSPDWHLSHYLFAQIMTVKKEYEEAKAHCNRCIALRPDHAIGYVGLACILSLSGDYQGAIDQLKIILESNTLVESYKYFGNWNIRNDSDFNPIRESSEYSALFKDVIKKF